MFITSFRHQIFYQRNTSTFIESKGGLPFPKEKRYDIILKNEAPPVGSYQTQSSFKILNELRANKSGLPNNSFYH